MPDRDYAHESRPRGRADLDGLIEQIVAESLSASWASSDDPAGVWTRSGSRKSADRTLADLTRARDNTRALLEGSTYDDGNEFAIGAAENRVNYCVGENGLKYEAVSANGRTADPSLLREVQQFVDAFAALNNLPQIERETLWRADRDGEAFLRFFLSRGIPEVDFVQPERIFPPTSDDGRSAEIVNEWGVVRGKLNRRDVRGYTVDDGNGAPEFISEQEIAHLKLNVTSEWVRGWPTFEPVRRSLVRAEELLVAMTASGKTRAKIALITTIPGWNAAKADALVGRLTTRYQDQPSGEQPKEQSVEELPYGAHLRVREGTTIQFPPPQLGANEMVEGIQANLRTAGARLVMPEWMFSGLPDAKYSNAFVVEAPSLRMFKALQATLIQFFGAGRLGCRASVVWRAMRMAVRAGYLNPAALTDVEIKVSAPSLETRDKQAESASNSTYINLGVKSRETVQEEVGLDPAREKARVEAEAKTFGLAGRRSGLLGGQEGDGGVPDPARAGEIPSGTPAAESLARAVSDWLAEGGAGPAGVTFPESDHFGLTDAGEKWVSEELYALVSEAERKGLVLKEIEYTRKRDGKKFKRKQWVRAESPKTKEGQLSPHSEPGPTRTPDESLSVIAAAMTDPKKSAIPNVALHLDRMEEGDLRYVGRDIGVTSGSRQEVRDAILKHLKGRGAATGEEAPRTVAPPIKRDVKLGESPLPKSKATVTVPTLYAGGVDQQLKTIYGDNGDPRSALAASVGMPDDAKITTTYAGAFIKKFSDDSPKKGATGVRVEVTHPDLDRVSRFVGVDGKGKRFVRNEILEVKKDKQGSGIGVEIFTRQVEAASSEGIDYIETHAVGSFGGSYNGYYTWPQFGYNAPIGRGKKWDKVRAAIPGAKSIQDVMDAPRAEVSPAELARYNQQLNEFDAKRGKPPKERTHITGEEWWKLRGFELRGLKFDLRPGSRSMKKLAAYLKKKSPPKAAPTPTPAPPT